MYCKSISQIWYALFLYDWSNFSFSLLIHFDINQHSVKRFSEQWAGWDGVSQQLILWLTLTVLTSPICCWWQRCSCWSYYLVPWFLLQIQFVFAKELESVIGKGCTTGWRAWLVDMACNTGVPVLVASLFSICKSGASNWLNPLKISSPFSAGGAIGKLELLDRSTYKSNLLIAWLLFLLLTSPTSSFFSAGNRQLRRS